MTSYPNLENVHIFPSDLRYYTKFPYALGLYLSILLFIGVSICVPVSHFSNQDIVAYFSV